MRTGICFGPGPGVGEPNPRVPHCWVGIALQHQQLSRVPSFTTAAVNVPAHHQGRPLFTGFEWPDCQSERGITLDWTLPRAFVGRCAARSHPPYQQHTLLLLDAMWSAPLGWNTQPSSTPSLSEDDCEVQVHPDSSEVIGTAMRIIPGGIRNVPYLQWRSLAPILIYHCQIW